MKSWLLVTSAMRSNNGRIRPVSPRNRASALPGRPRSSGPRSRVRAAAGRHGLGDVDEGGVSTMQFTANEPLPIKPSTTSCIANSLRLRHTLARIAGIVRDLLVCAISGFKPALFFALTVTIFLCLLHKSPQLAH